MLFSVDTICPRSLGSFLTQTQNNGGVKKLIFGFTIRSVRVPEIMRLAKDFVATLFFSFCFLTVSLYWKDATNYGSIMQPSLQVEVDSFMYVLALSFLRLILFPISGAFIHAVHTLR